MIVLGFDTATPATAVALRLADGTTLRAHHEPVAGERPGHTSQLLQLASELLAQADRGWGDLGRIAVGVGPGTFTGLRVGVATARGLGQSLGVQVVGVGSLRVLAQTAVRRSVDAQPPCRGVLAMIDARRGEAFLTAYDAHGELLSPRALASPALPAAIAELGGERRWLAVGDGALRFRGCLEEEAVTVPEDSSPLHRVDAAVLCELALRSLAGRLEAVLPDYRRRPDAEIALEKTGAQQ